MGCCSSAPEVDKCGRQATYHQPRPACYTPEQYQQLPQYDNKPKKCDAAESYSSPEPSTPPYTPTKSTRYTPPPPPPYAPCTSPPQPIYQPAPPPPAYGQPMGYQPSPYPAAYITKPYGPPPTYGGYGMPSAGYAQTGYGVPNYGYGVQPYERAVVVEGPRNEQQDGSGMALMAGGMGFLGGTLVGEAIEHDW